MKSFLSSALLAVSVVSVVTCGGNVVVDPPHAVAMGGSTVGSTGPSMVGIGGTGAGGGCTSDADCPPQETCDTSTGLCSGIDVGMPCQQCACLDPVAMGGCGDICDQNKSGTPTPNFCNGVPALPQCAKCLLDHCGGLDPPPNPSDPSACM
jgi:hypothetical protein